jgi:hypothetical protein
MNRQRIVALVVEPISCTLLLNHEISCIQAKIYLCHMSTFSFDFQPDYCGVIDRHSCGRVLPVKFQVKPCRSAKLCCLGVASSRSASNSWTSIASALPTSRKRPTRRVSNSSKSPTTVLEASMRVPRCLLSPSMRDAVLGMSPTTLHAKCPLPPTLPKHDHVLHPPHKGRNRH